MMGDVVRSGPSGRQDSSGHASANFSPAAKGAGAGARAWMGWCVSVSLIRQLSFGTDSPPGPGLFASRICGQGAVRCARPGTIRRNDRVIAQHICNNLPLDSVCPFHPHRAPVFTIPPPPLPVDHYLLPPLLPPTTTTTSTTELAGIDLLTTSPPPPPTTPTDQSANHQPAAQTNSHQPTRQPINRLPLRAHTPTTHLTHPQCLRQHSLRAQAHHPAVHCLRFPPNKSMATRRDHFIQATVEPSSHTTDMDCHHKTPASTLAPPTCT